MAETNKEAHYCGYVVALLDSAQYKERVSKYLEKIGGDPPVFTVLPLHDAIFVAVKSLREKHGCKKVKLFVQMHPKMDEEEAVKLSEDELLATLSKSVRAIRKKFSFVEVVLVPLHRL